MIPAAAQLALDFTTPAPVVQPSDVDALGALLRRSGTWTTATQVARHCTGMGILPAWNERRVRAIAEASDGAVVSFPGSKGYILFDLATEAEISHAIGAIRSQGKRMLARSIALENRHRSRRLVDRPQPTT